MKRLAVVLAVVLSTIGLRADDACIEDVRTLGMLYQIREMVLSPSDSNWEISQRIDQLVDLMREPLPDGGYRWVHMIRPDAGGPVEKDGHMVQAIHATGDLDSFESTQPAVYAVRIVVPRKKSLFRANEKVWVERVVLRIRADGGESERIEKIGKWMSPDTSRTIDLGVIADRVDARAEVATAPATKGQALVELHFLEAVPRDDPDGPHYDAIMTLGRIRNDLSPENVDLEVGRLEKRLYPASDPFAVTLLLTRLREYDRLMKSDKPEDQEKAKKKFSEIERSLRR